MLQWKSSSIRNLFITTGFLIEITPGTTTKTNNSGVTRQRPGQVIKRETIKTDATGKARLIFDTPRENYNQDFEYRIEARVTDSSRREIVAADNVRVTRQRYYVYPRPERNIYRPKDKVTIDIKAIDANEQPVTTTGTVKITRDYWWEVWIDPSGREVKGTELRLLREKPGVFPPAVSRGQKPWALKFRGYQHDEIETQTVKTDNDGSAQLTFQAPQEGYYHVAWLSSQGTQTQSSSKRERVLPPIKAETYVFVANNASTELVTGITDWRSLSTKRHSSRRTNNSGNAIRA